MDVAHEEPVRDEILVQLCQKGDNKAFEELVIRYQNKVFSIIYRMVRNKDTVRDLAQDVFIKAFKAIGSFKGKSSFYTWLYRIAVHSALNHLNLARVRTTVTAENETLERKYGNSAVGRNNSIEEGYLLKEASQAIALAVNNLREDYRRVTVLKEYEYLSYEEIAQVLDIPIGTVRSRLNRARKELKECLKSLA